MSKQRAILQSLGLATILSIGFGFIIFFLAVWFLNVYLESNREWESEGIRISPDGVPIIEKTISSRYNYTVEYFDLNREKINLPSEMHSNIMNPAVLPGLQDFGKIRLPLEGANRVRSFVVKFPAETYWYLIHDANHEGRAYFIGYDAKTNLCIGYLGRLGFSQNLPPRKQWFPIDASKFLHACILHPWPFSPDELQGGDTSVLAMLSGNQLLKIDLRSRSIITLLELSDMVSISYGEVVKSKTDDKTSENLLYHQYFFALRTTDRILILDAAGKQVCTYIIPEDLRSKAFDFYELGDEKAIISQGPLLSDQNFVKKLVWIDSSGRILRGEEIILGSRGKVLKSWEFKQIVFAVAVPAPIWTAFIASVFVPLDYMWSNLETNYISALTIFLHTIWLPMLLLFILSAVLAGICYRRQRRMAQPWTWVWVGFVFLFGVPGFLGYLFHRRWPVMEQCPACGKDVPRDRETCSSCQAEFPRPAPKGIEVFA